ncbi:Autotransporter beta-domain-containing protein [Roseateles sp. YR242]|uniref:autotransporter outer membrane beta-barrel domain-containing protein n=1 Tax=Roseateles sp. YR242 TaxID=1855305 RepID=UPI0008B51FDA|nr:autotransporter outer membrane beta-barrel domain-containing protein [Roseateles sp. YR242]SEL81525.1 Autotransporter beta-domain-containing protein [Roseateles sp. YR242]
METAPLHTDSAPSSRRSRKRSPRKADSTTPGRARLAAPNGAQPVLAASLVVEVTGRGQGDQLVSGWVLIRFSLARCLVLTGALEGDARDVALRSAVKQVSGTLTRRVRWVIRRLNGGLLTVTALSVRGGHQLYRSLPIPEDRFKAMTRPGCLSAGPYEQVLNETLFYGRAPAELHARFLQETARRAMPLARESTPTSSRRSPAGRKTRPMPVRPAAPRARRALRTHELRRSAISLSVCAAMATAAPVHYASAASYTSTLTRAGLTDRVFAPSLDAEGRPVFTLQQGNSLFTSTGPGAHVRGVNLNGMTTPVVPQTGGKSGVLTMPSAHPALAERITPEAIEPIALTDLPRVTLQGASGLVTPGETGSNRADHWAVTDTNGMSPSELGASEGPSTAALNLSSTPTTAAAVLPAEAVLTAGEALDAMRNLLLRTSNWTAGNVSNSASRADESSRHVWATPMASHDKTDTSNGRQYRQNVTALNLGGDWYVGQVGNGAARAGVSVTQGHVDDAYARGNGIANMTSVNGHVSVRTRGGAYVAASVGAATVRAVYDATSLEPSVSSGRFRTSAATASLEGGVPFELSRGLSLEPSASVVGAVMFKDNNVTTAGVLMQTQRTTFGQMKAGLTLRHLGTSDSLTHQVYVRASALKGFGTNPAVNASKDGTVIGTQAVIGQHSGHEEVLGASIGVGNRKALAVSFEAGHQKITSSSSGWAGMVNVSFRW